MKSIITDDMEHCYICGNPNIEIHHCLFGINRKNADRAGLVVPLCVYHHRGQGGVHHAGNKALDDMLKQTAQRKYEETHSREEWMQIFGRNYLD